MLRDERKEKGTGKGTGKGTVPFKQGDCPPATSIREKPGRREAFSIFVRIALTLAILGFVIFGVPKGFRWPQGAVFTLAWFANAVGILVWMKRKAPELLRERRRQGPGAKRWDRILLAAYGMFVYSLILLAAADAGWFHWSRVPLAVQIGSYAVLLPAMILCNASVVANRFASSIARIQSDRNHSVVKTGPYRHVRHPMYLGVILIWSFAPLALGSVWALIPGAVCALLFVLRANLEDRMLMEELPGYKDYAQKTRYRLLPGVW